ncbi:MAG: serine/threonine-protein kinase [Acidobacteriota bacterium]
MKYCPICKTCYDDNDDRCQKDRVYLVEAFPGARIVDTKYRIDALIGQGGMGTVYRATHLELDRVIALKVVLPDFVSSGETLERFRREARAAARLNHPNVITIYDFGVLANGRAYLAMELLTGQSLRDELEKVGMLSPRRVLEILRPVCEAVQAAHNAGVIHRDLKPDNIVLESNEFGHELIKVVDFGIAKLKETAGVQALNLTGPGLVMGTPHYMSPEQCKGEELDARSDIYSLGVMLYEMLSGHVPFDAPTPSAVIIQHAIDPPRRLSLLRRDLAIELETVVMKALAKSRQARQQTVIELFAELERATPTSATSLPQTNTPVVAPPKPVGTSLPISKRITPRDPSSAAMEVVRANAEAQRSQKDTTLANASPLRPTIPPPIPPAPTPIDPLVTMPLMDTSLNELDVEAHELRNQLAHTKNSNVEELPITSDVDLSIPPFQLKEGAILQGHEHVIKSVIYTPDGRYLISASSDGAIKIWDLNKRRVRGALRGHELSVNALAVSPSGDLLASASSDGTARIWDLSSESEIANFNNHEGSLRAVAFAPNGKWLAVANDANIELWDINARRRLTLLKEHVRLVEAVEFSRDNSLIISGGVDETVRFWDIAKKVSLNMINCPDHCINAISTSVDGILATAGKDRTIRLWDIASRAELAILEGHQDSVRALVFSARGDYLASGDWSGMLKLWDTATGAEMTSLEAHDGAIMTVAFSPDEKQIASAGYDQLIKLWNIEGIIDL